MDPITHGLSGLIISKAGFYQRAGKIATVVLLISALLPDIDHIPLRFLGPLAYLQYHRGITHSLFGAPLLGLLFAGIVYYFIKSSRVLGFKKLFLFSIIGIFTHIFLDLITSYGTQIFAPFSSKRYSLDLIFIIDFYLTSIILIPLLVFSFKKKKNKFLPILSIVIFLSYISMTFINKTIAINKGEEIAKSEGIHIKRIEAIPLPLSPFKWSIFVEDSKRFHQININLLDRNNRIQIFEKRPLQADIVNIVEELDIVKTYLWFARFPVVTVKKEVNDYLVEYFDLRFNSLPPRKPFLLRLLIGEDGSLKSGELLFHTLRKS